jgi:hypothetical protein
MKISTIALASAALLIAALSHGQSGPAKQPALPGNTPLLGVWREQMGGFPAVSLVVTDEGVGLSGAVQFYFQARKTVNDPWISTPGLPEPMFRMHTDGNTLSFQISHRRAHPPRTLSDPPVSFYLTVTGPNQAELVNENEKVPALVMVRSDY